MTIHVQNLDKKGERGIFFKKINKSGFGPVVSVYFKPLHLKWMHPHSEWEPRFTNVSPILKLSLV